MSEESEKYEPFYLEVLPDDIKAIFSNRHWPQKQYDNVEFIAGILKSAGYAERKMTAEYIAPTHGGLNVIVDPFFDDGDEPALSYEARVQMDVVEDWLHKYCHGLIIEASLKYPASDFDCGHKKRRMRVIYCIDVLVPAV